MRPIIRLYRGPAVELRPRLRWGRAFLNRNHNLFSGLEIKSKSMIKSKKCGRGLNSRAVHLWLVPLASNAVATLNIHD